MGRNSNKNICSQDEFACIVANSLSMNEVCEKLESKGYDNYSLTAVTKRIQAEKIPIDHFKGTAWRKNLHDFSGLIANSYQPSSRVTTLLIQKRGHRCENCGLKLWLGNSIPLEVHHIDGNTSNNDESNLILLCPNCHALTDNFKGKNINNPNKYISEEQFADLLRKSKNIRKALLSLGLSAKGDNYRRAYEIAIKYDILHILEH